MDNTDDVETLLDQAWRKQHVEKQENESSSSRSRKRSTSRNRRSTSKSRDRSRRHGKSSRSRKHRSHSRSRRRERSRSRGKRSSSKSRNMEHNRDKYREPRKRDRSPIVKKSPSPVVQLSSEDRDARTVLVMQLRQHTKVRDLIEFFSSVGQVHDAKLICCNRNRFKGIAYVEFKRPESVTLALGLTGQKLLGAPIIVQLTQAEKNRLSNPLFNFTPKLTGPMRLYVGSLHHAVSEEILREIFEPFGKIESIDLIKDSQTNKSKGYCFITYRKYDDGKNAMEQMNGFELVGNVIKVMDVTDRTDVQLEGASTLDSDEIDRSGVGLGASGRLQLMMKLAKNADFEIPQEAANVLSMVTGQTIIPERSSSSIPAIATQCFMLTNMFDPATESNENWEMDIRNDVIEECSKHGGVLHVYVDKSSSQGNVYAKSPTIAIAVASVNSLHGRCFAGRVVTASYIPISNYHSLFPDAMLVSNFLAPTV